MLGLNRRSTRRGRSIATLFGSLVLSVCTLGAVGVGSASAIGEQCSGASVTGKGAYLQSQIQGIWTDSSEEGFNGSGNPQACSGKQGSGGTPKVSYTAIGSGHGLNAWGAFDGVFHDKAARFIGTAEPPAGPAKEEGTQLNRMNAAIGSDVAVVPLTQTAIAIVANPPALPGHSPCVVGEVTAVEIESVFSGQLTNWRELADASDPEAGGDCDQAMTRVVREEDSGMTYQFKHYLDQVEGEPLECTGKSPQTWEQLQPSTGGEESPNRRWPRKADCQEGEGPVTVATTIEAGPWSPLKFVLFNPGTITYGGLPEVEGIAPKLILAVDNGIEAASPSTKENDANCAAAKYPLPEGFESGVNIDWSQVYGSNPTIGKFESSAYPICTLNWVVAATDIFSQGVATTVSDYLDYVNVTEIVESGRHGHWYLGVPATVAEAAAIAIGQIKGGEEEEKEGGKGLAVLCMSSPEKVESTLVCPGGEGYAGQVRGLLNGKSVASFESTAGPKGTVFCEEASFIGKFEETGISWPGEGVTSFTFGSEENPCTSTLEGEPKLLPQFSNGPYDASKFVYLASIAPHASFVFAKSKGAQPELSLSGGSIKCLYIPDFLGGQVVNGFTTTLAVDATWKLSEGTEGCPVHLEQETVLELDRGKAETSLYVAGE